MSYDSPTHPQSKTIKITNEHPSQFITHPLPKAIDSPLANTHNFANQQNFTSTQSIKKPKNNVTMTMMISSMGSSEPDYAVRDFTAAILREAHNSKASGRRPHKLRLDNQRVSYSFCCLHSIPEEEPLCRYLQAVRDEPLVVELPVQTPLVELTVQTTDVLLNNTTAVNSDSTLTNVQLELPAEEANNNNNNKDETVQSPELQEPYSLLGMKPENPAWTVHDLLQDLERLF